MKTYSFLRRAEISPARVDAQFKSDPQRQMLRALVNPDHSPAAVKLLTDKLRAQGVTDQDISAFHNNWDELSVGRLAAVPTPAAALRRSPRWRFIHRGSQLLGLLCLIAGIICQILFPHAMDRGLGPLLFSATFLFLFAPGIKAMIWIWPCRILLLRPFGLKAVSKDLKRFIRKNVAFQGHVFTLADQHMKESFWVWLLESIPKGYEEILLYVLYWTRLVDTPKRRLYIKKAYHYRVLKRRLGKRWLLNTMWLNSWDKIRKIRTTDPWWQRCVDLLAANCELLLVDLTVVKSGTHWELRKISGQQMEAKSLFIVRYDMLDNAQKVLAEYWPGERLPRIFTYDARGICADRPAFNQRFAEIAAQPRPAYRGKSRVSFWFVFSLLLGWLPLYGLLGPLILMSQARRSEGRLRGRWLARVTLTLNLLLTATIIGIPLYFAHQKPHNNRQYADPLPLPQPIPDPQPAPFPLPDPTPAPDPALIAKPDPPIPIPAAPRTLAVPAQFTRIQDAIDDANPGDTVRIAAGRYQERLVLKDRVTIQGVGSDKVTLAGGLAPLLLIDDSVHASVTGITFDGAATITRNSTEPLIKIHNSAVKLSACVVDDALGAGISISGTAEAGTQCLLVNVTASGNSGPALSVFNRAAVELTGCTLHDNQNGLVVDGAGTQCRADGCTFQANLEDGVSIQNGAKATITDSSAIENKSYGLHTYGAGTTLDAKGNLVANNHEDGILAGKNTTLNALENRCTSNTGEGIYFLPSAQGTLQGNICKQNHECGIFIGKGGSPTPATLSDLLAANQFLENLKGSVVFEH